MNDLGEFYSIPPFSLGKKEKAALLNMRLNALTARHYSNCAEYRSILDSFGVKPESSGSYLDIPYLPVSLFKELDLLSVDRSEIAKTMTSSGTTGQAVSKIYIDKATASNQQKALVKIVNDFAGSSRMPMIIIDSPSVLKDRSMFSARGAGILGFSIFGSDRMYALNEDMSLNYEEIDRFLTKHAGKRILLFGFTFMIWRHLYLALLELRIKIDLSGGILIHGGGWKTMAAQSVSQEDFKKRLGECCGLRHVYDYYGMVEQTGSIYMECGEGHLHASIYSDVVIRKAKDFSACPEGEAGIIQLVSVLPESYPGHSILTEDEGVLLGEDDCPCGRLGKYFKVLGRLPNAEIRGCSDTYSPSV